MRTALCDLLGIEHPIVGFTPSEHVAAAISRAGGLGVLGCVRFNDPAELDAVLTWMDENTDGRPYGVDVVMPATVPDRGHAGRPGPADPAGAPGLRRADRCSGSACRRCRTARRPATACSAGCTRWPAQHVEVALAHPAAADRERARPAAARRHRAGARARHAGGGAGRARPSTPAATSPAAWTSSSPRATRRAGTPARSPAWCWCPRSSTRSGRTCRCSPPAGSAAAARSPRRSRSARSGVWMGSVWLTTQEYAAVHRRPRCSEALLAATLVRHRPVADLHRQARPAAAATAGPRPGPSRTRPSRCRCRCRTCWSARRTSG